MQRYFFALTLLAFSCPTITADDSSARQSLTKEEAAAGWKLLFDGESLKHWRGLGMDEVPDCWVAQEGCLKCVASGKKRNDLTTDQEFENFEFTFEWRFPNSKGNSGVKYRVQETKGNGYAFGPEYQCLTDSKGNDKFSTASLYGLFAPEGKELAPAGEFNQSKIVVDGNHWEHWLNGRKVVEVEFGSEAMNAAVEKSKFRGKGWAEHPRGRLVLQNHNTGVDFRNLKIRELPATKPAVKEAKADEEKPPKAEPKKAGPKKPKSKPKSKKPEPQQPTPADEKATPSPTDDSVKKSE
ncbi:hypothetical protein ETAA8_01380 [Anatilimnocola aggregata]|uniref:3-keto-alpha-glucoside-1,2-lyase/3-keto-2-hydroxy-glucal hydratase domain-containing protein n=1 Tax=Anatilimnocola aggregata TaxID=2528021 RepID=A0A517Y4D3_9BACT|nr:DUF1080 domain-containing protein [Anatilimnocola aggregata]QDU25077.1 hypothetical protein ETAA8_01380 [Anatilimnocola aggregata]